MAKKFTKLNIGDVVASSGGKCFKKLSVAVETSDIPTDLTGYIVTVPAGWTKHNVSEGYYYIEGNVTFYGVNPVTEPFVSIRLYTHDGDFKVFVGSHTLYNDVSFALEITGGTDVTNPSLIQWLYDNNATFEKTLISFTIDGEPYQAEEGMTWEAWVASDYNTNQKYNFNGAWPDLVHSSNAYYVYNTITNAYASKGDGGGSSNGMPIEFTIVANGVYATNFVGHGGGSN